MADRTADREHPHGDDTDDRDRLERDQQPRWSGGRNPVWDEASDHEARGCWDWERGVDRYPPMRDGSWTTAGSTRHRSK